MNNNTKSEECIHYSQVKIWKHVVQCSKIMHIKIEFIVKMYKELKAKQLEEISNEEVRMVVEDIRRLLRNNDEEIASNQGMLSMKYLFRGISIRDWFSMSFGMNKYIQLNYIINKHYMNFYILYWQHRNNVLHNRFEQRLRIIDWYKNKKEIALGGEYSQVRKFILVNEFNIEEKTTEYIKRWVLLLKEFKKKVVKYKGKEDIRGFCSLYI
jgi:hypothetical protein